MSKPENYRFEMPVEVRFADLDAMGHLNNAKYLTYTEQARIYYVRDVCVWEGNWRKLGIILARTEIDYKLPIAFDDKVMVYIRVSRLGSKSFDFEYMVTRQRAKNEVEIAALSKSVMVAYDYENDSTLPISDLWRKRILAYEPAL
jgi:acyl-CoA thioester hydrolase